MTKRTPQGPFAPGIRGPQTLTDRPEGGIGMPAERLWDRSLWFSPFAGSAPHNLPSPGDRLSARGNNLIGQPGSAPTPTPTPGVGGTFPSVINVRERHRYATLIEIPFAVDDVQSVQILSQPTGLRNMLLLRNASGGAQVIFVSFGVQATLQSVLRLTAGQAVLLDTVVPQNEVNAIADTPAATLVVAYSQYPPI